MTKLKFTITTPEKIVFEDEVDQLTVMTISGEITILPNHIPLVSLLKPGEMRIKKEKKETPLAVAGGFLEVGEDNQITVLADAAEHVHELDEALVEAAKKQAEKILQEKFNTADYEDAALALEQELSRLRVIRKYRHHGSSPRT